MKYTSFGKTGLQVSQVALGTGNFGTGWGYGADPDASKAVFNAYADAGGNFIDSADVYQFGQSEELLGTLLEGRREDFVLATKFSNGAVQNANRLVTGNSRKAMVASVEASLKRLKTDRIDIYWAHHPDGTTPLEEIVRGFEDWRVPARSCTRACRTSPPGASPVRSRWPNFPMPFRLRLRSSNIAWCIASPRPICSRHRMRSVSAS